MRKKYNLFGSDVTFAEEEKILSRTLEEKNVKKKYTMIQKRWGPCELEMWCFSPETIAHE